ncbi:MAG: PAS domain-containing protein [Methanospirillum sp.]|uniref:PAS domain-containing protein n=1 Tax=Methanospirillum sp. TaxID=45200 RepID=UPI002372E1B7|nr:PAS domain-containing protein [Methanospirillum sp.]MDD1729680.1 PAS domain-containing protein [Methanospirillum sp.]
MIRFTPDYFKSPESNVTNICEMVKKDGTRVWISYTIKVINNSRNDIAGILFIGQDFTDRKQVEEKLVGIINFLPDPTFVVDTEGRVIAWNHAIETLTGVKAEKIMGKGNNEYSVAVYNVREPMLIDYALKPDQKIPPNYFNCKRDEHGFFAETYTTYLKPEGIYLWGKASPLYDSSGNLIGAIESLRDMTLKSQRPYPTITLSESTFRSPISK